VAFHQRPRQGRLAHLPGSEKGDDGVPIQEVLDPFQMAIPKDHVAIILENRAETARFSRN
jgi:hypothetical protein